jgi:hypothetical protein
VKSNYLNLYAAKFAIIFLLVKVAIFFKETLVLNFYGANLEYQTFLYLKPTFDLIMLFASSVFYLEQLNKNRQIQLPFFQILFFIILGLSITYFSKGYSNRYLNIYIIIVSSILVSLISNSVVVFAKEFGSSSLNFLVNSAENYFILIFLFLFHETPFLFIFGITIVIQLVISIYALVKLRSEGYLLKIDMTFRLSDFDFIKVISASFLIVVLLASRFLFKLDNEIASKNFSLLVASSVVLIFERYLEYSGLLKKDTKANSTSQQYILFICIIFIIGSSLSIIDSSFKAFWIKIIIETITYFLLLIPVVMYFIIFRWRKIFPKISIAILVTSFLFSILFSDVNRSDVFLITSSFTSILGIFYFNKQIE